MAFITGSGMPQFVGEVTLDPSSITAVSASVETFTPAALAKIPKEVIVYADALNLEAGLSLAHARMTATGVLELTIVNYANTTIDPASQAFKIYIP